MQINAKYPWLIQPSQLELTATPEGYLISGWFYILRKGLGISWLFPASPPISNQSACPGIHMQKLSNRRCSGKYSRDQTSALQQEAETM